MRAKTCLLIGALLPGCDLASGLDAFHLRDEQPDAGVPCAEVPSDDFTLAIDEQWVVTGTASVTSEGGDLVITALPGESGGVESRDTFDFTGCQAHLEVVAPPGVDGQASFLLSLPDGYVGFVTAPDGTLRMGMSADPTLVGETTLVSSLAPSWWRLRDVGADLVFETSNDGIAWSVKRSIAAPRLVDATLVIAGQARPEAPGEVVTIVDNLNTAP